MKNKRLWLLAVVVLIAALLSTVKAVSTLDRVQLLHDPTTGKYALVRGDSLIATQLTLILAGNMEADTGVFDYIIGSASTTSLDDDTIYIGSGDGALRWDGDSLGFTNNGTTWQFLGSGSGGGSGDLTEVQVGNGLIVTSGTGPIPVLDIDSLGYLHYWVYTFNDTSTQFLEYSASHFNADGDTLHLGKDWLAIADGQMPYYDATGDSVYWDDPPSSALTQEEVEDYAGGMVASGTETHITVTYDDGAGMYNFVVDWPGMDDMSDGSTNAAITLTQESNFETAYGWGDHSGEGYLTASPFGATIDSIPTEITDAQFNQYVINRLTDTNIPNTITIDAATEADSCTGGAVRSTTSKIADSALAVSDDAIFSDKIVDQEIVKADIDSTGDLVVADIFRVTSGEADSSFLTQVAARAAAHDTLWANTPGFLTSVGDGDIEAGAVDGGAAGEIADGTVDANDLATDAVSADELNATGVESELEGVLDLEDLQGAVTDGQVPNDITIDEASDVDTTGTMIAEAIDSIYSLSAHKLLHSAVLDTAAAGLTIAAGQKLNVTQIYGDSAGTLGNVSITGENVSINCEVGAGLFGIVAESTWVENDLRVYDLHLDGWDMSLHYVPFTFVHGSNQAPGDNAVLSLEGRDNAAIEGWIFRDSTLAADQVDTVLLTLTLPARVTQCDSLVIRYITSSATTTTSAITDMRLTVDATSQWTYATDEASATIERLQLNVSADGDFDAGEHVTLELIFTGDADAFVKVYHAYLVCH